MAKYQVERVALPSRAEFYRTYDKIDRPHVFTGGMENWPARTKWTFDWFKQTHGKTPVVVTTGTYDIKQSHDTTTLGDYIDSLLSGEQKRSYLSNFNLFKMIPELQQDVRLPDYPIIDRLTLKKFWMARDNNFTQLHADYGHNCMGQIAGKKRWVLYSPKRSHELMPDKEDWNGVMSKLDFSDASEETRKYAAGLEPDYDFVVEPGEIIFLPYGWWHRVYSIGPSINVNLWWWNRQMILTRTPRMVQQLGRKFIRKKLGKKKPATASHA